MKIEPFRCREGRESRKSWHHIMYCKVACDDRIVCRVIKEESL